MISEYVIEPLGNEEARPIHARGNQMWSRIVSVVRRGFPMGATSSRKEYYADRK